MTALRILLVEDDAMIGELLADMLVAMGYEICALEATENGAVIAAGSTKPDLIIIDAQLGDGSGIVAVDRIQRTGFVPYLFMSGNVARVLAERPSAVTLEKPFQEAALAQSIRRALDVIAA